MMCNKMEFADTKWAFEKMLELLEEYHPNFENDIIIEDCYLIYDQYYED